MCDGGDTLLHLVSAVHRQEIGRIGVMNDKRIGCIATVSEHQNC